MEAFRRWGDRAREAWSRSSTTARWSLLGGVAGAGVGAVLAVVLLFSGGGGEPPAVAATASPSATGTAAGSATATGTEGGGVSLGTQPPPDPDGIPDEVAGFYYRGLTEEPEPGPPTITSLAQLHELYGEAPDATFGRLRIPVLGVDAPIGQRVAGDVLPDPSGPDDVVWYDFSQWEGMGGVPGGGGNAVYSGHVDYFAPVSWADAIYRGGGVFYNLQLLSPGDVIEVEVGGQTLRYGVVWQRQVSGGSDTNWGEMWSSNVAVDSITIVTCGGEFNVNERSYYDRVVVRAERL